VLVPSALLAIPLVGALGAMLAGGVSRLDGSALAGLLLLGAGSLAVVSTVRLPAALAGIALFYGLYRMVLVVADARLQERIAGRARATVTSVANVLAELSAFAVYAAYGLGGMPAVTVLLAVVALLLPMLQGRRRQATECRSTGPRSFLRLRLLQVTRSRGSGARPGERREAGGA
jgi:hypothetical protein